MYYVPLKFFRFTFRFTPCATMNTPSYFQYWAKAHKAEDGKELQYHLLPYHLLDVAAINVVLSGWFRQVYKLYGREYLYPTSSKLKAMQLNSTIQFHVTSLQFESQVISTSQSGIDIKTIIFDKIKDIWDNFP